MADVSHPCPFPEAVLDIFRERLPAGAKVLDPYGGSGRIHELWPQCSTVANEIEREWVEMARERYPSVLPVTGGFVDAGSTFRWTRCDDSRNLPDMDGVFDAVATSPDFGNRMADQYDGERCKACIGTGLKPQAENGMVQVDPTHIVPAAYATPDELKCGECGGSGRKVRSRRYTYRLSLGRRLSEGNGAGKQWGRQYRAIHEKVIAEFMRVLKPGGMVLLDIKNHRRGGGEQKVMEWWIDEIHKHGGVKVSAHLVDTKGLPMSGPDTNDLREWVLEFRKAG